MKNNKVFHIAFRVDGNLKIGMGHAKRCLALADYFIRKGCKVDFISHISCKKFIKPSSKKIKIQFISNSKDVSKFGKYNLVVIDSYKLNLAYERKIKNKFQCKLMVIDDFFNRKHDCNYYLNQNSFSNNKTVKKILPINCKALLGPKYALISPKIRKLRAKPKPIGSVKNILINFGSNAPANLYSKTVKAIQMTNYAGKVNVVLGFAKQEFKSSKNFIVHKFVKMPPLFIKADLIIGATGSSSWERCVLGRPSLTLSISKDQLPVAKLLIKLKAAQHLGRYTKINSKLLSKSIQNLLDQPSAVTRMAKASFNACDGLGIQRVYKSLKL
jgi:UDP-2,4-diacetamido-2,4,6-trideoxy-beta-L-altropyranose hydrolase